MRASLILAACALAATLGTARAEQPLAQFDAPPITGDDLAAARGGTDATEYLSHNVFQDNQTDQAGTNQGNVSVAGGAIKASGTIYEAQVTGNHGITALMQNTGDLVNMNNATSVNVYLR